MVNAFHLHISGIRMPRKVTFVDYLVFASATSRPNILSHELLTSTRKTLFPGIEYAQSY
jgi:hypothetical protein